MNETQYDALRAKHQEWLAAHYKEQPPIRLAEPAGYDGEAVYVDQLFSGSAAIRGIWQPPVKRPRGRPRKTPLPA